MAGVGTTTSPVALYQTRAYSDNPGVVSSMVSRMMDSMFGPHQSTADPAPCGTGGSGNSTTTTAEGWPHYTPDNPHIDTNNQTCVDTESQPLVGPDGKWDGTRILNAQNQLQGGDQSVPASGAGAPSTNVNKESACGPAALIGGAVMAGPGATAELAARLADSPCINDPTQQQDILAIHDRLQDGTATHHDLSRLQQYAAQAYSQPDGSGTDADGITTMEQDLVGNRHVDVPAEQSTTGPSASKTNGQGLNIETPRHTQSRLDNLRPGQSFIMNVKTDPGDNAPHHFVTIGRDLDGHSYVYDPAPKDNEPNVVTPRDNPAAFRHYIDGTAGATTTNDGQPAQVNLWEGGTMTFNGGSH